MDLVFSDSAKNELENLPQELKVLFLNRLKKMMVVPAFRINPPIRSIFHNPAPTIE